MGVPGGARAWLEADARGALRRRFRCLDDRVLPHRAGGEIEEAGARTEGIEPSGRMIMGGVLSWSRFALSDFSA